VVVNEEDEHAQRTDDAGASASSFVTGVLAST